MRRSGSLNAALAVSVCLFSYVASIAQSTVANDSAPACRQLPSHNALRAALVAAVNVKGGNGGFGLNMWGTVVNRDGVVCAVAFTGSNRGDQWPGSRVISAQKGQHRERLQSAEACPIYRRPLLCRAARRQPVWSATQQSGRYVRCLWRNLE